ncbi:hypothetical protein AbraCBS73388_007731 [Aspergillus brasiliensis]|uniref:BZIP domain-containing protein n=1 Tax=Aspergillus brasiliensis TaxID=319629 RepID=A0A9W6DNL3_9EURO|nr:hypothetical protein AbraCBS73388_007731 [Aspergillus brasiliensis]
MQQTPGAQPKPKFSRPKRVITEARKLQNREAQRAYRQRQKERLQSNRARTGEKACSSRYQQLQPYPTPKNVEGESSSSPAPEGFGQSYILPDAPKSPFCSVSGTILSVSTTSSEPLPATQSISSSGVGPYAGVGPLERLLSNLTPNWSLNVDYPLAEFNGQPFFPTPAEVNDESAEHFVASISSSTSAYTSKYSQQGHNPYFNTSSTYVADPYKNCLQPPKTNLFSACLYNASTIGIGIEDFFSYNCMSLCSPFYRPAASSTDPQKLLSEVSTTYPLVPAHLRPTLPQILIPHHPLFDLIPIPIFRSRAIILSSAVPHLVNIFELKGDIVEGGLLCLGSGSGSGQPWEVGSWEVAPWFFKKWKLLLDRHGRDLWGEPALAKPLS